MVLTIVLFTACALCALACAWCVWRSSTMADRAEHSEKRLMLQRGRITALEAAVEALEAKHRKLAGRIYADEYWSREDVQHDIDRGVPDNGPPTWSPTEPDGRSRDVCENYAAAQLEGPMSKAAQCTCAYCVTMRERRGSARAQLVPKGIGAATIARGKK